MKKYYANLLGEWTDITNSMVELVDKHSYFEENLSYPKGSYEAECFKYDYINVQHNNKNYRIHPSQIQIVTE